MDEPTKIAETGVITFPEGIPGFENATRFIILKPDGLEPLLLLHSVEGESVGLPVIPVEVAHPGYQLQMGAEDRRLLGLTEDPVIGKNVLCLGVLVTDNDPPTCNLQAPIVVNPEKRLAKQVVQYETDYSSAFPLPPD